MFESQGIFAIFPLSLSVAVLFALVFLVFKRKKHYTGIKTLFFVLSYVVFAVGILATFVVGTMTFFALTILIALALQILGWFFVEKQPEIIESVPVVLDSAGPSVEETINKCVTEEKEHSNFLSTKGCEFVLKASESFSEKEGLLQLLHSVNESIMKATKADGGAILLIDEFDDVVAVKSFLGAFPPPHKLPDGLPHKLARIEANFRFAQFSLDENIFGNIVTSAKPELIVNPAEDSRIFMCEEDYLQASSYIFVPMIVNGTVLGVLSLARKTSSPVFTEKEFEDAQRLTDFASSAVHSIFAYQEITEHSELTQESSNACRLQKTIHPKMNGSIPGATFGCFFNGAEGVCGDYFDIIPCRRDRISFVLADIAGKGMNSFIVMVMIRAIMQLVVNTQKTAATILSWTNRGITGKINVDHFASLVLVNFNAENNTIQYSSAGNAPILLFHSDTKEIEDLSSSGDPIGIDRLTEYKDKEFAVKSGDIVVLYTDGLAEAINENSMQYGTERIQSLIKANANLKAQDIASKLKRDLQEFCSKARQHDDQTLLVIKIN